MSTPNGQSPDSNSFCHHCGRRNLHGTRCVHCQSEFLDELPPQQTSDLDLPLIEQFQNLFTRDLNLQTFTNMLLPMLMSQVQSDLPQSRHRRGRSSRRIKRVDYRYLPSPRLFNIRGLNTQVVIFHENFPSEDIDQLPTLPSQFNGEHPTRNDTYLISVTPSNLQLHSTCTICLENFDLSSDVKQLPNCHHVFHRNCLTEWLIRHHHCPMCRTSLSSIQPTFNNQWLQQLLLQTFGSIKTINRPSLSSNPIESDQASSVSDTPQLPHFDPSANPE